MKGGIQRGATPLLAHDFASQSVVCYTLCLRGCEKSAYGIRNAGFEADEKSLISVPVISTEIKLFW